MTRGKGKYHTEKADKAFLAIMKVLSGREEGMEYKPKLEGKEYRYKELKKKTGLNDPTLAKYLKPLINLKLVSKRVDLESGKYPYPAYYRAEPEFLTWIDAQISTKELSEQIEGVLLETKSPMFVLELINLQNYVSTSFTLQKLKEDKDIPEHKLGFLLELFAWEPFQVLTWNLIKACKKNIDVIDIDQIQIHQLEQIAHLKKSIDRIAGVG